MTNNRRSLFWKVPALLTAMAMVIGLAQESVTSLGVADSEFGQHLVDQDGRAVYLYLIDVPGSASSSTNDTMWPPLLVASGEDLPTVSAELQADLVGVTTRADGTFQVTYNGWPLYYFADDLEAGQVGGHGLGGNWFLLDAQGEGIGVTVDLPDGPADTEEEDGE